ncbi:MAG: MATE family efflux transporter [Clostridia bacterium]|nr:MATE family efflux transporter [Clostridia bacterium]
MSSRLERDFTEGNVFHLLLEFCVPFLLANLLQALYGMVDVMVVGWFCETHVLTGVNSGSQVTHLVTMAVSGLTVGGTVLVAQYYAAKKPKDVSETIGTMFSLLFICAIVLMAIVLIFLTPILSLLNLESDALESGKDYLRICTYGTIFIFGYNAISAVQRGLGDSKRPLWFVAIACFINIALDFLLVGAFKMGASGAALATVIAQGISLLLAAFYLARRGFVFDFKPASFKIMKDKVKKLVSLGIPSSAQSIITNLSFLLMTSLSNGIGVTAGAAVGVVGKFNSIAILPIVAMSSSVSSIAAQNIAAEKYDRAKSTAKAGIVISFAVGLLVFIVSQLFAEEILMLFKKNDMEVVEKGAKYLRAFCFDYLGVAFLFSMNSLIIASGHATFSMISSSTSALILRAPVAWILSKTSLEIAGVGYAAPAATLVAIIMAGIFLMSGRWRVNKTGIRRES